MIHFPPSQAGRRGGPLSRWGGGQGRVPGPLARPRSPVLASSFLQRPPSPASGALFCCPPGPPPRPTCFGFEPWFSPLLPLCPVPAPPGAASLPTLFPASWPPGVPSWGQENDRSPQAASLPPPASRRLAAESPLPQEPAPISCPLALSPVINIGDGSSGSRHSSSEAGLVSCLHLCVLLLAQLPPPPFWAQRLGGPPIHLCWVGWESHFW